MDGRVLSEALAGEGPPLRSQETRRPTAASRATVGGAWDQYCRVSEVNGVRYLDEDNGSRQLMRPRQLDRLPVEDADRL